MKYKWIIFLISCAVIFAQPAMALNNPFKKFKKYHFGPNIAWYQKGKMAVKSGQVADSSDVLYFHLMLDKKILQLRLSKNDPGGDLLNSRNLNNLVIKDVLVDNRRLTAFQWCLDNQEAYSKKFKQESIVPDDICINSEGDFIVKLTKSAYESIRQAKRIKFVLEPFRREVTIVFDMQGYAALMEKIHPPVVVVVPKKVVKVVVKKPDVVIRRPKTVVKAALVKAKKITNCYARAPVDFQKQVKAVTYPCDNKAKKSKAVELIAKKVALEKQKAEQLEAKTRQQLEAEIRASLAKKERDKEWALKQKTMWVKRCQKHWNKGVSPCFCKKYLSEAPKGVVNTCTK